MRAKVSNDEHDLAFVHQYDVLLSVASGEDEKLNVMAADLQMNSTSGSTSFRAQSVLTVEQSTPPCL